MLVLSWITYKYFPTGSERQVAPNPVRTGPLSRLAQPVYAAHERERGTQRWSHATA